MLSSFCGSDDEYFLFGHLFVFCQLLLSSRFQRFRLLGSGLGFRSVRRGRTKECKEMVGKIVTLVAGDNRVSLDPRSEVS